MAKLTLTDVASLTNEGSALAAINSNFAEIEAALENTLSRDGTAPNEMDADFDMNGNQILNADSVDTRVLFLDGVQVLPQELAEMQTEWEVPTFHQALRERAQRITHSVSGPLQINVNTSNRIVLIQQADITELSFTGLEVTPNWYTEISILRVKDSTGTPRTIDSYKPSVSWEGRLAPTYTQTASGSDLIQLFCYDGVNWRGWVRNNFGVPS